MSAIVPVDPRYAPARTGRGRLYESAQDRENQRIGMEALLLWWRGDNRNYDAIDLGSGSPVDYLVVPEGSYLMGPLPRHGDAAVEYKRRKGSFGYWARPPDVPTLFIEKHKHDALLDAFGRGWGKPIFMAEWDNVVQFVDMRVAGAVPGVMARLDRGLPEDTDPGYYYSSDLLSTITQATWARWSEPAR